jgi:DNA (cytosine-5)-methyltransferase 1
MSGINRNSNSRSSLLWEVERLLIGLVESNARLPKFLLMENVTNILSDIHSENFDEWKSYLKSIGYYNQVYTLSAANFGIPQNRKRTFMLSVLIKSEDEEKSIERFFAMDNLEERVPSDLPNLSDYLRLDYSIKKYMDEAMWSNPNATPSRKRIFDENIILHDGQSSLVKCVNTITTKQDRNPNSGLVIFNSDLKQKATYRNLTPRECFLLMGFEEDDFQALIDNDFYSKRNSPFFTREKLIRLVGNSIVVNVLEEIFKQVEIISHTITND